MNRYCGNFTALSSFTARNRYWQWRIFPLIFWKW